MSSNENYLTNAIAAANKLVKLADDYDYAIRNIRHFSGCVNEKLKVIGQPEKYASRFDIPLSYPAFDRFGISYGQSMPSADDESSYASSTYQETQHPTDPSHPRIMLPLPQAPKRTVVVPARLGYDAPASTELTRSRDYETIGETQIATRVEEREDIGVLLEHLQETFGLQVRIAPHQSRERESVSLEQSTIIPITHIQSAATGKRYMCLTVDATADIKEGIDERKYLVLVYDKIRGDKEWPPQREGPLLPEYLEIHKLLAGERFETFLVKYQGVQPEHPCLRLGVEIIRNQTDSRAYLAYFQVGQLTFHDATMIEQFTPSKSAVLKQDAFGVWLIPDDRTDRDVAKSIVNVIASRVSLIGDVTVTNEIQRLEEERKRLEAEANGLEDLIRKGAAAALLGKF